LRLDLVVLRFELGDLLSGLDELLSHVDGRHVVVSGYALRVRADRERCSNSDEDLPQHDD
jgi:hypothetical protein